MPVSDLHYYIRNRDYGEARSELQYDPAQATSLNTPKQTPLAVVVQQLSKWDVYSYGALDSYAHLVPLIDELLQAYPLAVAKYDKHGTNSMLMLCQGIARYGIYREKEEGDPTRELAETQLDVLWELLRKCPNAVRTKDEQGRLPLEILLDTFPALPQTSIAQVLRLYPEAPLHFNKRTSGFVMNPLVRMCEFDRNLPELDPFLEICPDVCAFVDKDSYDSTPASLAGFLWRSLKHTFLGSRRESRFLTEQDLDELLAHRDDDKWTVWLEYLEVLIQAAARYETTGPLPTATQPFRAVHAACALDLPQDVIHLLPTQLSELDDENGWLPLHVAAANPRQDHKRMVLQLLTQLNPLAVSVQDSRGRFPLHLALETGAVWVDGVSTLVQMDESALTHRDGRHHLYPAFTLASYQDANAFDHFMSRSLLDIRERVEEELLEETRQERDGLSGMQHYSVRSRIELEANTRSDHRGYLLLETLYELLRANPSILARGISSV